MAPTQNSRYQSLDLWRGLICLFVVIEHAAVAIWGGHLGSPGWEGWLRSAIVAPFQMNLGTPLFFVISGYCIAASIVSCRRRGSAPMQFLARRLWRVFPSYWAALLVFAMVVMLLDTVGLSRWHHGPYALELPSVGDLDRWQWFGNITLTETWRPHVGGIEVNVFTRVAWSLCYQEQFYLICFFALLATRKTLFRTLGIATAAIISLRVIALDAGAINRIEGTFPLLWHQFAIGLAVYRYLNGDASARVKYCVLGGLTVMFAASVWTRDTGTIGSVVFGLGLIALRGWDESWTQIRRLDPLRAIGRCSYSIYLIHLPVIVVLSAALGDLGVTSFWSRAMVMVPTTTIAATLAGLIFYRVVEARFLDLPAWTPASESMRRPVCAELPATASLSASVSGGRRIPSIG